MFFRVKFMQIYNEIYKKQRRKKGIALLKESLKWLLKIIFALFLAFITVMLFGTKVKMTGNSMVPTIENGDNVLINIVANFTPPKAGELIVFRPNGNPMANLEIKRVVGVPGDKVKISEGHLYVNGKRISDDLSKISDPGIAEEEITLAADDYFVLSDNREIMQDSRNPDIGMLKRQYCVGKAWFIISPSKRRGFLR